MEPGAGVLGRGDSDGEMVIVNPDREAETGSFVVAKINHDEATFK